MAIPRLDVCLSHDNLTPNLTNATRGDCTSLRAAFGAYVGYSDAYGCGKDVLNETKVHANGVLESEERLAIERDNVKRISHLKLPVTEIASDQSRVLLNSPSLNSFHKQLETGFQGPHSF